MREIVEGVYLVNKSLNIFFEFIRIKACYFIVLVKVAGF